MNMESDQLFGALWRFMHLSVHRYASGLTGEALVVLTIMMLDRSNDNPTISDLADITGLPKSNISRYVANQLKVGHLIEKIDPTDRRRRVLVPTEEGIREQEWMRKQIEELAEEIGSDAKPLPELLLQLAKS